MATTFEDLTVLVVDDDQAVRKLMGRILGNLSVGEHHAASSGAEALTLIDDLGAPDIVLCDLNMPELDGIAFLRHMVDRGFVGGLGLISGEDPRIINAAVRLGEAQQLNILGAVAKPATVPNIRSLLERYSGPAETAGNRSAVRVQPSELRRAIGAGHLGLHYQPKVNVMTGALVGAESLVRWHDRERGMIPPDSFIPLAEEHGLIDAVTETVLESAIRQAAVWQRAGLDLNVAVNVSIENLNSVEFPELVFKMAEAEAVDLTRLRLEVTESRLMEDIRVPLEILTRLRMRGVGLSIDDFGTGHSSLEQLQRIPFDELKIDRSFVNGASGNATSRAILGNAVALANDLGMTVVAEGVEEDKDWELLRDLGVGTAQGFFVARPMPVAAFDAWRLERSPLH